MFRGPSRLALQSAALGVAAAVAGWSLAADCNQNCLVVPCWRAASSPAVCRVASGGAICDPNGNLQHLPSMWEGGSCVVTVGNIDIYNYDDCNPECLTPPDRAHSCANPSTYWGPFPKNRCWDPSS